MELRRSELARLMDQWHEAQREVELYLAENYPVDTPEKMAALRALAVAAAEAEKAFRAYVCSS